MSHKVRHGAQTHTQTHIQHVYWRGEGRHWEAKTIQVFICLCVREDTVKRDKLSSLWFEYILAIYLFAGNPRVSLVVYRLHCQTDCNLHWLKYDGTLCNSLRLNAWSLSYAHTHTSFTENTPSWDILPSALNGVTWNVELNWNASFYKHMSSYRHQCPESPCEPNRDPRPPSSRPLNRSFGK